MNSDFGKAQDTIVSIMTNISALKNKISQEEAKENPKTERLAVWRQELARAEKALDKRRVMA